MLKKHDKEIEINSQTMHQFDKKTNKNDIVAADEEERFEENSESNEENDKGSDNESGEEYNHGPFVDVIPFSTIETYEMRVQSVTEVQCFFAESGTELRSNMKLMVLI